MNAVEFLLDNGANVNTKTSKNFTLLMYCAKYGDMDLIKMVVKYGASINDVDLLGFSALDYAVQREHFEAVEFLVENGATITDNSYMIAVENNLKKIVYYFDTLDPNKEVFLKKSRVF